MAKIFNCELRNYQARRWFKVLWSWTIWKWSAFLVCFTVCITKWRFKWWWRFLQLRTDDLFNGNIKRYYFLTIRQQSTIYLWTNGTSMHSPDRQLLIILHLIWFACLVRTQFAKIGLWIRRLLWPRTLHTHALQIARNSAADDYFWKQTQLDFRQRKMKL